MEQSLKDEAIYILREAYFTFKKPAILWSTGKDSTCSLHLCREAFLGQIPFPVIHLDTHRKFPTMYEFRDRLAKEWGFELIVAENKKALEADMSPEKGKLECCTQLKTEALKQCLRKYGFDALILSIRRDEHGVRAKERAFSKRDTQFRWDYKSQGLEVWDLYDSALNEKEHMRVHPILSWTEYDVWKEIVRAGIPINPLYFARQWNDGVWRRYRSLGCLTCTNPIESHADTVEKILEELRTTKIAERSGRAQDKEQSFAMARLRSLGYM